MIASPGAHDPSTPAMIVEDQSEVMVFLENPATWGRSSGEVVRIDTHGAAVFLVGERAYKMKRAVRFPYMDFSTLERRRAACEAEIVINRRTAPMIYLGVVAVTREAAGLALDGGGTPVEWLVVMRRFDQENLFDRMARSGHLRPEHIDALAEEAAAFHDVAERDFEGGGVGNIARAIDLNRDGFAAAGGILEPQAGNDLVAACRHALKKQSGLLEARRAHGFVRRCHGDLHLRNVCLIENKPTLFDAIEFNDDLAVIDVLYDIAFLVMDLVRDGRDDLASRALNRYLETSDDYGGLAALPLFLAVRAGVRAQTLAAAALAQSEPAERGRLSGDAGAALKLAGLFLAPAPARVIAVGGLSGSGKSTLARALAPLIAPPPGAVIVRSDVIRKRLAGTAITAPLPEAAYTPQANAAVYRTLVDRCATIAAGGRTAIADAVFARPAEREEVRATARRAGVEFRGIWLDAGREKLMARVSARAADASDAGPAVVRRQLAYDVGKIDWRIIDASGPPDATLAAARDNLI